MSTFAVPVVQLDEVKNHPNADRLDLACIKGWQCVVQKGLYSSGDWAVYIPEGALVPEEILSPLGLDGKLAGPDKNRVKTVRLRGEYSQGVVMPLSLLDEITEGIFKFAEQDVEPISRRVQLGDDLAELLGIEKYEPPIPIEMSGVTVSRPYWFHRYTDVENINNFPDAFSEGELVYVHEKIHGTNVAYGMSTTDYELLVSSRNWCLAENETNLYWRAANQIALRERLRGFLEHPPTGMLVGKGILFPNEDLKTIALYGEIFGKGVQNMDYGCKENEIKLMTFDIAINGRFLSHSNSLAVRWALPLPNEYILKPDAKISYSLEGVRELAQWPSHLWDGIREGVVIRSANEQVGPSGGRKILKAINPAYLEKDNTEYH